MKNFLVLLSAISGTTFAGEYTNPAYQNALETLKNLTPEQASLLVDAPEVYEFSSRFQAGESSVYYSGQTFRQVLINDLKAYMGSLTRGGYPGFTAEAELALDSYYSYDAFNGNNLPDVIYGFAEFKQTVKGVDGAPMPIAEGIYYDDLQVSGKQLRNKTAGNDNALRRGELKGWSTLVIDGVDVRAQDLDNDGIVEPEDLIDTWLKVCAYNATEGSSFVADLGNGNFERIENACVTEAGLDLTQLVQKFLHGSVSFSQAARDYLSTDLSPSKGLNVDNSVAKGSATYSALEHHWDEAFGYFGAARDYLKYDKSDIASKYSVDTNADGAISLLAEKNLGLSINAAKRELGAAGQDVNFVFEGMDAFLKGRHLISRGATDAALLKAQAVRALGAWEQTIAATVIHYINYTVTEMNEWGTADYSFKNHAKFWGEMKGFALAFQFSPVAILSDAGFDRFHALVGDAPVLGTATAQEKAAYEARLLEARDVLQEAYGFSDETVASW